MKVDLSTGIDRKKDNTIKTMKQNLSTLRLKRRQNEKALMLWLNRAADSKVITKGDVKEITRKDNTIKSLKQNVQKLRLEATQNKKSLMLSLNRAVIDWS